MKDSTRLIGRYTGTQRGPLLLCFGGMHGNELAGIEALEIVFKMLEAEPTVNPVFQFKGRLVGLKGNLRAIHAGKRFIQYDLNRQWSEANVRKVMEQAPEQLEAEARELKDILDFVHREIEDYQPEKMVVLDLHTTSAYGGIFAIVNDDPESLQIGIELHVPVVMGMLEGIKGTTLHYFTDKNFPVRTVAVSFEGGQHSEYLSVNRCIAAITNCLSTIGCVKKEHIENRHDYLLSNFSKELPRITKLMKKHTVSEQDQFLLLPGFRNFQAVKKDQLVGYDANGPILSPEDGLILMPRYQQQGEDGFFLIRPVEVENRQAVL